MHRDMKIGLALGLLLLGTVAAFFFREEEKPDQHPPHLKNPEAVTRKLADKEGPQPYFQETSSEWNNAPTADNPDNSRNEDDFNPFGEFENRQQQQAGYQELPDVSDRGSSNRNRESDVWYPGVTPAPINRNDTNNSAVASSQNGVRESTQDQFVETGPSGSTGTSSEFQYHQVRRGDSLSSLATYYLGTESRYLEIYNLNKDVLKNPHDLQVGMKLRIPPKNPSRDVAARTARTQNVSSSRTLQSEFWNSHDGSPTEAARKPEQIPTPRFVPVYGNPFLPGNRNPYGKSGRASGSANSNRTHSQIPSSRILNGDVSANANPKRYTIRSGDSLEKIALQVYGTRSAVPHLVEANRGVISDPHRIQPGMVIVLPRLE